MSVAVEGLAEVTELLSQVTLKPRITEQEVSLLHYKTYCKQRCKTLHCYYEIIKYEAHPLEPHTLNWFHTTTSRSMWFKVLSLLTRWRWWSRQYSLSWSHCTWGPILSLCWWKWYTRSVPLSFPCNIPSPFHCQIKFHSNGWNLSPIPLNFLS